MRSKVLMVIGIVAVLAFSSLSAIGLALADSGALQDCGAPAIFKSPGIGISIAAVWYIGEQVSATWI